MPAALYLLFRPVQTMTLGNTQSVVHFPTPCSHRTLGLSLCTVFEILAPDSSSSPCWDFLEAGIIVSCSLSDESPESSVAPGTKTML